MYPELLEGVSPALMKRMHGKSFFNYVKVDEGLMEELGAMTKKSFNRLKKEKLVGAI